MSTSTMKKGPAFKIPLRYCSINYADRDHRRYLIKFIILFGIFRRENMVGTCFLLGFRSIVGQFHDASGPFDGSSFVFKCGLK